MNKRSISKFGYLLLTCVTCLVVGSCGNGSSTSSGRSADGAMPGDGPTTLTISITDAVIDSAQEVWIQFTGLTIKPADDDAIDFIFSNANNINLLSLSGTAYSDLISNEVVPLGNYDWIRLHVNATNDGNLDSYIRLDDGTVHELSIPSGSQSGLQINSSFEITAASDKKLMIDFDLRKSIVIAGPNYLMRPTLRMVDMDNTGNITGTINPSFLTGDSCSDSDPNTGNAVYLFEGANAPTDDIDNQNPEPFTSASVELNSSNGNYEYVIGYVPAGDYTLAFTCQSDMDDPSTNDSNDDDDGFVFVYFENVSVVVTDTTPLPDPVR